MKTLGNSEYLKKVSKSTILTLIREKGPLSRTEIVKKTKLGWGTITRYSQELIDEGLLFESGNLKKERGRNSTILDLTPQSKYFIGIDFGSRKTGIVLSDIKGIHIKEKCIDTENEGPLAVERLIHLIHKTMEGYENKIASIGVGVSGAVDFETGEIIRAVNISNMNHIPLGTVLQSEFKIPAFISNAVNARLFGELKFGAGVNVRNMIYLWLGTGIGSAIVSNGKVLIPVAREKIGDIGHIMISPDGPPCKCGLNGCLEAYVSYEKIRDAINHGKDKVLSIAAEHISTGLFYMIQLHSPEKIVIAGKYMEFGDTFLELIRDAIKKKLPRERFDSQNICFSTTGIYGGASGAIEFLWANTYGEGGMHASE